MNRNTNKEASAPVESKGNLGSGKIKIVFQKIIDTFSHFLHRVGVFWHFLAFLLILAGISLYPGTKLTDIHLQSWIEMTGLSSGHFSRAEWGITPGYPPVPGTVPDHPGG